MRERWGGGRGEREEKKKREDRYRGSSPVCREERKERSKKR